MQILPKDRELTTLIDTVGNTTYVGLGKLGSDASDAVWQILRIQTSGTVTTVLYADGDQRFNNVWDDRLSLTYVN